MGENNIKKESLKIVGFSNRSKNPNDVLDTEIDNSHSIESIIYGGIRKHKGVIYYVIHMHLCRRKYIHNIAFKFEKDCLEEIETMKVHGAPLCSFFRSRGLPLFIEKQDIFRVHLKNNNRKYGFSC